MEQLTVDLFQTVHRFHMERMNFQKHGNLASVEFFILLGISVRLENKKDELTLSEIIKTTGMTMSAASKKISILEKKGLLERKASDKDKRKICIKLTEKGHEICQNEKTQKYKWMENVIERMGEEDTRKMLDLINKMFDIMEEMEQEK